LISFVNIQRIPQEIIISLQQRPVKIDSQIGHLHEQKGAICMVMTAESPRLTVRLAQSEEELERAFRLRYEVFVERVFGKTTRSPIGAALLTIEGKVVNERWEPSARNDGMTGEGG
jgi:hypothetical protein